jgi:cytochrome d ubiquinol oxidase subunit II
MNYDLETLRLMAWAILVALSLCLALFEGISLGLMMFIPLMGETSQRRVLITSAAPTSLGSLAWWLVLIAVLFSAWPVAYAVSLASLQPALWLISLTLMIRPLALYFYDSLAQTGLNQHSDKLLSLSGWLPAALLGLSVGNLLKGIPFHLESDMHIAFLGDFMSLIHPFGALISLTCLSLLLMHGSSYCLTRSDGRLQQQTRGIQLRAGLSFLVTFTLSGLWITHLEGYHVTSEILTNATSNPLAKFVKRSDGLWLDNYEHEPSLILIPTLAFVGGIVTLWLGKTRHRHHTMIASSVTVAMTTLTAALSLFPFLLPSNLSLNSSLTIWDSSASQATLHVLIPCIGICLPLIMIIQRWTFTLFNQQIYVEVDTDAISQEITENAEPMLEATSILVAENTNIEDDVISNANLH